MASMSVSGVVSGMDWESMITSTIEAAQEPAMVKVNKRTNLTNKKSLFEEMKVMMQSIQTSLTSLKLPSTYKAKDIEIENMGTGSYKKILTATVNADAEIGVHTLEVKQLATAQTNRSKQISSTLKSTMGSLESSKMYINIGSQKIGVDVYNTDTLESLKSRINTTLKTLSTPVNVTAAVVDNKLVIKSDSTGLGTTTVEGTLPNKYNAGGRNSLESIITNAGSGATTNIYVDGDAAENLKVSSGGSSYTIHEDYEVVNNEIRWKQYKNTDEIKLGDSVGATYKMAANDKVVKTVKRGSGDTDTVSLNFIPSDNSNFKIAAKEVSTSESISATKPSSSELGTSKPIKDDDGNEVVITKTYSENTDDNGNTYYTITTTTTTTKYYTYGTDFTYSDGKITWLNEESKTNEPSSYTVSYTQDNSTSYSQTMTRGTGDDQIDITAIAYNYKTATGSELGTKTLTGTDGVIRTYIDPDDTSLLNISDGTNTYEYGRDFVIRVKDDGNGYVVSWFVTGDTNSDGSITTKDSNIAVSTYTDYKDISTLNFKTAPTSGTSYKLKFANENIETVTKTVKSSDTDKSLETIFSGYDIAKSEYSSIKISDGTRNYRYGRDFIINDSGEIEWLEQTNTGPASYSVTLADKKVLSYDVTGSEVSNASVLVGETSSGLLRFYGNNGNNLENKYLSVEGTALPTTGNIYTSSGKLFKVVTDGSNFHVFVTDDEGNETEPYEYGRDFVIRSQIGHEGTNISWLAGAPSYKSYLPSKYKTGEAAEPIPNTAYTVAYTHTFSGTGSGLDDLGDVLGTNDLGITLTADDYNNVIITDVSGNPYVYSADGTDENADYTINSEGKIVWLGYDDEEEEIKVPSQPTASTEYELIYTSTDGGELFTISDAVTRSNSDVIALTSGGSSIDYDEMINGTVTITQGSKVFYENYDFEIGKNDNGEVTIDWKTGTNYEWYYPQPGANSRYSINLVTADGDTKTYSGVRSYTDTLDLKNLSDDCYFEVAEGSLTKLTYNKVTYDLTDAADDDETTTTDVEIVRDTLGLSIADGTNGGKKIFNFNWVTPDLKARDNLPTYGDEVEISYDYYANTFTLSDDGDGIIDKLGLNDDVTDAKNAIIVLDNTQIEKDLNDIGADYDNEISNLKGVTLHLKGVGEVSLDIFHDAEKAVESIQTYVDNYNSLMSWINTRMTESQVDEDTKATVDSDDFRMRWGLLHGNALLRNAKSQMRNVSAQNFTYKFSKRTSAGEIYGTMANNGLTTSSTFRLRIGSTFSDITIDPSDTLETIAAKINDDTATAQARNLHYDSNGQKLEDALLKASVEQDKLVISSSGSDEITISGTAAMNALKMNYTYRGVYQLGIGVNANATLGSTSTVDLTKAESGELEFNTDKFMEALEDNPDETQELMLMYANSMDNWVKSMTTASNDEYGSPTGSLSREIKNLENEISDIDEYLTKYQERIDRMEETLRTKYAAAEQRISKLSQQASAIASILQQLNNSGGGNNSNAAAG